MTIDDVAKAVADALDVAGIEFMLTGALASAYYGLSRSTMDADFLVQYDAARVSALAAALTEPLWLDPQPHLELFATKTYRIIRVHKTAYQVDLFPLTDEPFDRSRFTRRRRVAIMGRKMDIPSPEDIILIKLSWGRRKDLGDARDIIALQHPNLDRDYLRSWCQIHGTQPRFDALLAELKLS
jgi:hypothetical protein